MFYFRCIHNPKTNRVANTIVSTAKSVIKHWYLLLIVGIIFLAAGIWVMCTPLSTYLALSIVFSISFLIAGLMEVTFAISNRTTMKGWEWTLVYGLANLVIGCILIYNPLISITTLPIYVGFVVLFRSFFVIGAGLDSGNNGGLIFLGILGVIFGSILLWDPSLAGLSLVAWTSIALITAGVYGIYYSFQLKKLS